MLRFFVLERLEARQLLSAAWISHAPVVQPSQASRHRHVVPRSVRRARVDALTLPAATLTRSTGVISELRDGSATTAGFIRDNSKQLNSTEPAAANLFVVQALSSQP